MDTVDFLRSVLPSAGIKFLVQIAASGSVGHKGFVDLDKLAAEALRLSAKGKNVYFACAEYAEIKLKKDKNGKDYEVRGGASNAMAAKSLWLDIDVGKANDAASYDTKALATDALKKLITETGLPKPTVVSSGNGFHCYWLFDQMLNKDEWLVLADSFRQVTTKAGFKVDPSRDKDIASILRIPGTLNPKGGKEVKVVNVGEAHPVTYYQEIFKEYLGFAPMAVPIQWGNSLATTVEYPDSSLESIRSQCKTIDWFSKTGAPNSEPLWRACLGVAKFCVDGPELAHQWSKPFDGYSFGETQSKIDNWGGAPTLCDTFRNMSSECQGCTNSCKSPIQLGFITPVETVVDVIAEQNLLTTAVHQVAEDRSQWLPYGYTLQNGALFKMSVDKKTGLTTPKKCATPNFWPIARYKMEDGTYGLRIIMHVKNTEFREFDLPSKHIADGRSLRIILAANEIMVDDEHYTMEFMKSYSDRLRQKLAEVNTFNQYGWTADRKGVLMGDKLISTRGVNSVRLSKTLSSTSSLVDMYEVRGTKQKWIDGVDILYNSLEGSEPYQYIIGTQFGAWLCPLMEASEWNGIPLSVTSDDSGYAKTTTTKIGQNATTYANKTMVADATPAAVIGRASLMGNIPFLVDEITKSIPHGPELSGVLYALSNGRSRIGMKSAGMLREETPPFQLMATMTANKNGIFQLTESNLNPEAAQLRLFEINMMEYPKLASLVKNSPIGDMHREIANDLVNNHSCVMTEEFVTYLIKNMTQVKELLDNTYIKVCTFIGESNGDVTKERFYARHVTCTIVGLIIAKNLGYIRFNIPHLIKWSIKHVRKLRKHAESVRYSAVDKLANMLADFQGFILVTKEYENLHTSKNKTELPMQPLRGSVKARLVLGTAVERGRIIVTSIAVDKWCKENGVDPSAFREQLIEAGYIRQKDPVKFMYIARGVPTVPTAQQRCIELEYALVQGIVSDIGVTPLNTGVSDVTDTNSQNSART
jgi:hypothetical protein